MRHVVADRVAQHVVERRGLGHVEAGLADDGDELAFVVEARVLLGEGVDWDGVCGAGEGGGGFVLKGGVRWGCCVGEEVGEGAYEDDGVLRDGHFGLSGQRYYVHSRSSGNKKDMRTSFA